MVSGNNIKAFRLKANSVQPILRTHDDTIFEADDVYEVSNPSDNIHYASCHIDGKSNSKRMIFNGSAGCQVIAGFAKKVINPHPWETFRDRGYKIEGEGQEIFRYMLLKGNDAYRVSNNRKTSLDTRIRFGSVLKDKEGIIRQIQKLLKFKVKDVDGDFGEKTFNAVREFQSDHMSPLEADGIVGPDTASMLGIILPKIDLKGKIT